MEKILGKRKVRPLTKEDVNQIKVYGRAVAKTDGFDMPRVHIPTGAVPVLKDHFGYCYSLIMLYARFGLHRYNMLFDKNKNLKLSHVRPIFSHLRHTPGYYCITLYVFDPATPSKKKEFQVKVHQLRIRPLHLRCDISRLKGSKDPLASSSSHTFHVYGVGLPDWQSYEDDFQNTQRFYQLNESELQEHSWIRLYMELAFQNKTPRSSYEDLSHLHITKAVIKTEHPLQSLEERLKARHATVYIWFINMFTPRIRVHRRPTSCKIIVTRDLDDSTGELFLRSTGWVEEEADEFAINSILRCCPEDETVEDKEHDASASASKVAVALISSTRLKLKLDSVSTEYSAQYLLDKASTKNNEHGEDSHLTVKRCLEFALEYGIPKAQDWPSPKPALVFMKGEVIEASNIEDAFDSKFLTDPLVGVGAQLHVYVPQIDLDGEKVYDSSGEGVGYVGLRDGIIVGVEKLKKKYIAKVDLWYKNKFQTVKVAMNGMFSDLYRGIPISTFFVDVCVLRLSIN